MDDDKFKKFKKLLDDSKKPKQGVNVGTYNVIKNYYTQPYVNANKRRYVQQMPWERRSDIILTIRNGVHEYALNDPSRGQVRDWRMVEQTVVYDGRIDEIYFKNYVRGGEGCWRVMLPKNDKAIYIYFYNSECNKEPIK